MSIPATTVIKAKAVIDGTSDRPLEHAAVIVEGDTIKEVVQGDLSGLPSGPHVFAPLTILRATFCRGWWTPIPT